MMYSYYGKRESCFSVPMHIHLTKQDLLRWLKKQPADRVFDMTSSRECIINQFLADIYLKDKKVYWLGTYMRYYTLQFRDHVYGKDRKPEHFFGTITLPRWAERFQVRCNFPEYTNITALQAVSLLRTINGEC